MIERLVDIPQSHVGTKIDGKVYDLINVDFEAEPSEGLVRMVLERPGELVLRTSPEAAEYVTRFVISHLSEKGIEIKREMVNVTGY